MISIHAPVKGATREPPDGGIPSQDFNPRTREGCDFGESYYYISYNGISIHAPVKGATPRSVCRDA